MDKDKSPTLSDYKRLFKELQDFMNIENEERVTSATDEESWDLIKRISIEPNKIVLITEHTIIEFDTDFNFVGRMRKNRRKNGR